MRHILLDFQCEHGWRNEICRNKDGENGSEAFRGQKRMEIACLFYADDLVLCMNRERILE